MVNKLEVLAPAGSPEAFYEVIKAGADAVYIGGEKFGARAYAQNFTTESLLEALDFAHLKNRKVYLTVNTLLKDSEIEELYDYLLPFYENGLDAVIVQDFGVLSAIHAIFPELAVHASTQMTVTGAYGAALLKEAGAKRIVCARELSLDEIAEIYDKTGTELEVFVHGALCYCYSGACLLSSMIGGRSGNRGRCAQPCRLSYTVCDENKKQLRADAFVLSPKDLCGISFLPQLLEAGVTSLKIEGRMKQAQYAAGVTAIYRKYADLAESGMPYRVDPADLQMLMELGNRSGFTDGYFEKQNGRDMITFERSAHTAGKNMELIGAKKADFSKTSDNKVLISGALVLSSERPARLTVSCRGISATAEAAVPQKAQSRPLILTEVRERIQKTGDTPFQFETLEIDMEPDLFLPNGVLNQLRRDALEYLKNDLLAAYRRTPPERSREFTFPVGTLKRSVSRYQEPADKFSPNKEPVAETLQQVPKNVATTRNPADEIQREVSVEESVNASDSVRTSGREAITWTASLQNRAHLPALCDSPLLTAIYLDCCAYEKKHMPAQFREDAESIRQSGKQAYLLLPAIFRSKTAEEYRKLASDLSSAQFDGWVARNYEEIRFLREIGNEKPVIFDHSLYTYNRLAKSAFDRFQPLRTTLPLELNRKELLVRACPTDEWIVYGFYPLMTSAQCVCGNTQGCAHTPKTLYLKDRMGKYFPVRNYCDDCYNVIYNSLPVMLFPMLADAKRMGIGACRLSFTVETEAEVREILTLAEEFENGTRTAMPSAWENRYTNGHYKRGVE